MLQFGLGQQVNASGLLMLYDILQANNTGSLLHEILVVNGNIRETENEDLTFAEWIIVCGLDAASG